MQCVRLTDLLRGVEINFVSDRRALEHAEVSSMSTDTRSLKRDDLFIAIPGEQYDGHAFIEDALRTGASGVLFETRMIAGVSRFVEQWADRLFISVNDTRRVLGNIARNYLKRFKVRKVALTGSAGKTTTKALIHAVLSQRFRVLSSIQSFNNDIGVPKTVLNVDGTTEVLVQEMGTNHPGEIGYLAGIVLPDCALITNIGPAHIGYFGSERAIAREKKEVFRSLGPEGTAFVNAENPFSGFLRRGIKAHFESFGLNRGDLHPERIIRIEMEYSEFVLGGRTVRAQVLGSHGVVNATAAALVGRHFGLSFDEIKKGIEQFQGESGRGNVYRHAGVTIVDESYNANPLSVSASLAYLGGLVTPGRKILVFADMLELGRKADYYHSRVARDILRSGIDVVYTYGEKAAITGKQCKAAGQELVFHFEDIEVLRDRLQEEMRDGDVVLVKGSRAMRLERAIRGFV